MDFSKILCAIIFVGHLCLANGLEYLHGELVNFGKFEVRMKIVKGSGTVNCFCLFRKNSPPGGDQWMEYDIEILGHMQDCMETTAHVFSNNTWAERNYLYQLHQFQEDLSDDYHTYGCEWAPNYVTWYVDGNLLRKAIRLQSGMIQDISYSTWWDGEITRETEYDLDWLAVWAQGGMMCAFNVWTGCDPTWCGNFDQIACDYPLIYSWFRYYSYTPGAGPDGSDFTLTDWDNFDGPWDDVKWSKMGTLNLLDGKAVGNACGNPVTSVPADPGDINASVPIISHSRIKEQPIVSASLFCENNTIRYRLPVSGKINLSLYDMNGRVAETIADGLLPAGEYTGSLKKKIAAGTYIISLKTPYSKESRRFVSFGE
jgi:hypothetical protein